jgi:phage tail-like protein
MPDDGARGKDVPPSCRFYVQIEGLTQAVFTEIGGLQLETDVTEYQEGGWNGFVHRLPGRTRVGTLTLKRGITSSNEFFKWYEQILYGKIEPKNVSVLMFDVAGNELLRWNFIKAFPIKWTGPQFTADGSAAAVESIELAHEGLGPR